MEQQSSDYVKNKLLNQDLNILMDNVIELEKFSFDNNLLIQLINQGSNRDIICWALLKLSYITDILDAEKIVILLTDKDSRVRELASEFIYSQCLFAPNKELFDQVFFYDTYIKTVCDINPRVTRNITACYKFFKSKEFIYRGLINAIKGETGYYVEYWSLDGLNQVIESVNKDVILETFQEISCIFNDLVFKNDDLIKEKIACLLKYLVKYNNDNPILDKIIKKLKHDKNYYVRVIAKEI